MGSEQSQDFLDFLDEFAPTGKESVSATDAPSTDAPAPTTDEPAIATDAPPTDAPATEAPTTDAPKVPDDDDGIPLPEPENLAEAYKNLVRELTSKPVSRPTPAEGEPKTPEEPEPVQHAAPVKPKAQPYEEVNYLEGIDFEEVVESPEALNKLLNKVAQANRSAAVDEAIERVLTVLPETITRFTVYQTTLRKEADRFYEENPDLVHVKPYVAQVANNLAAEHPDWEVRKVFSETASVARKVLGLQAKAIKTGARKVNTPVPKGSAPAHKQAKPKLTPMQQDIMDIISEAE